MPDYYYKRHFREVSSAEEIPNPNATILEMYMDFYSCDIVGAYNIRMRELWKIYESERARLTSPDYEEELRAMTQRHIWSDIGMLLSLNLNASPEEIREIIEDATIRHQRSLERMLEQRDWYVENVLTPKKGSNNSFT